MRAHGEHRQRHQPKCETGPPLAQDAEPDGQCSAQKWQHHEHFIAPLAFAFMG
ncbi:Uncharacterised protein [Bordetella pertussis]|nr:Uncharacterised protein [Bordetella pertussis]